MWLLVGFIPFVCLAADNVFTGTGLWSDTARWSLSHIPTVDEVAWIQGTAALDSSQTPGGMNVKGTLDITGASSIFSTTGHVQVGYSGSAGVLTQTGGSFETDGNFYVGEYKTGSVIFTDTDVVLGKYILGHGAIGSYEQQGGTLLLQGSHAVIGHVGPGKGTMSITDTSMTSNPSFVIGFTTDGKFYATNSIIDCNAFAIADQPDSKGYAELIDSAIVDCSSFLIGSTAGAVGTAYASQSNITSDYVRVGSAADGTGTLVLTNSEMKTAIEFSVGYNGFGTVSNFGGKIESPKIYLGQFTGSCGNLYVQNGDAIDVPQIYMGNEVDSTGVLTLASGTLEASSIISCGNYGVGSISNVAGVIKTPDIYIGHNGDNADAYMYIGPDSSNSVSYVMQVGRYGKGKVDCYGSIDLQASANGLFIGNLANAEGTLNLYPGSTLTSPKWVVLGYTAGTGIINQYGGDVEVEAKMYLGGVNISTAAKGIYNLYGGTITVTDIFYVGRLGTGVLTVDGGNAVFPESINGLTVSTYDGSTGTVNLIRGSLAVAKMRDYQGYSQFFFDGGTLKALASKTDFMIGLDVAEIREGGAVIDTAGQNITIAQSITHDSRGGEPAKDGGLTKIGEGTLIMTGTLGFTGDLGIDGGTLHLSTATYSLASGSGLWGAGTLVPPAGSLSVSSTGFVAAGSTNGVGTLTIDGSLTVDGEVRVNISNDGTTCGSLSMGSNALTYTAGSEVIIENPENLNEGTAYTIVSGSNISGMPDESALPDNWILSTRDNKIRIIYNSGTIILVR